MELLSNIIVSLNERNYPILCFIDSNIELAPGPIPYPYAEIVNRMYG